MSAPRCHVGAIEPDRWNGKTIVATHGAWHTAEHYVRTLDGRPGWAHDFANAGYRVLLVDQPGTGRSPTVDDCSLIDRQFVCDGIGQVIESVGTRVDLLVHSMSGPYGFRLLETHGKMIDHLVAVAPSAPPHLTKAPDAWDDLGSSVRVVQHGVDRLIPKAAWMDASPAFVIDRCIGASARFPPVSADEYLGTLTPIWSGLSLELLRDALAPPREQPHFSGTPAFVVVGPRDTAQTRATAVEIAAWLDANGAPTDLCQLSELGIDGNGHMLMLEDNSAEIAGLILDWLHAR